MPQYREKTLPKINLKQRFESLERTPSAQFLHNSAQQVNDEKEGKLIEIQKKLEKRKEEEIIKAEKDAALKEALREAESKLACLQLIHDSFMLTFNKQ